MTRDTRGGSMSDDDVELVVTIDSNEEISRAVIRGRGPGSIEDLEWARSMSMGLVVTGSLLGLWFGVLLIAASPADVLDSPLFGSKDEEVVTGQILSALDEENGSDGGPVEGVYVRILNLNGDATLHEATSNRDGRFTMSGVRVESLLLEVTHPGNKTMEITFNPGDQSDLGLTLSPGSGTISEDWRHSSNLGSAVVLATVIAILTITSALVGLVGAAEIKRGQHYRRTQYLCGLALFSRGGIFIGPLLILAGMGMLAATKHQFADRTEDDK